MLSFSGVAVFYLNVCWRLSIAKVGCLVELVKICDYQFLCFECSQLHVFCRLFGHWVILQVIVLITVITCLMKTYCFLSYSKCLDLYSV